MKSKKYISFEPWSGGFCNIRMSYELAAAIAFVTGRTLILPPTVFCAFLSKRDDKTTWFDMFRALDYKKFAKNFDCVFTNEVDEYRQLESKDQYFKGINNIAKIYTFGTSKTGDSIPVCLGRNDVLVCGPERCNRGVEFIAGRKEIDLDCDSKFIHFPKNLFGRFYYHVYAPSVVKRNLLKTKILDAFAYRDQYLQIADSIANQLSCFNAIHVRRNDFLLQRREVTEHQLSNIEQFLLGRIDSSKGLYIATDEKDTSLFDCLSESYQLNFLSDFRTDFSEIEALLVEQLLCARAEKFLGSYLSTYTDYIHVVRASFGMADCHREGINYKRDPLRYQYFPWQVERYGWQILWDYYWEQEKL